MIENMPEGLLLDLNGVLYEDDLAFPGALETVEWLRNTGLSLRFLTNTSTVCSKTLSQKLGQMGFRIPPEEIIGPTRATGNYLRRSGHRRVHLLLAEDARLDFEGFETSHANPDAVVVGDIGERWNYRVLNQAFEMLMYGAELIALHKNRYWQTEGRLRMDIGGFVKALEYASGKSAKVIGKPSPAFFQAALDSMGLDPDRVWMVGDDIHSDVEGARLAGLRGILVKTGKYRPELAASSGITPDAILDDATKLRELLEKIQK